MKKCKTTGMVMAGVLGAALFMTAPAYAANETSKNMEVTYGVDDSYTLSIPEKIDLDKNNGATGKIGVEEVNIQPGKALNIKITTNKALLKRAEDTTEAEKKVTSEITVDGLNITDATSKSPVTIATYTEIINTETKDKTITFAKPVDADGNNIIEAGNYTGTITFMAAIEDIKVTK